jgi:hypothetical protein
VGRIGYALAAAAVTVLLASGGGGAAVSVEWAVAWIDVDERGYRLWVLENGARPRPLVRGGHPSETAAPAWSPDGTNLVFLGARGAYVVRRDGRGLRRIAPGDWASVVWSPNGRSLALVRGFDRILVAALDGSTQRRLGSDARFVSWLDDERLICRCGERLVVLPLGGGNPAVLATTGRDGTLGAAAASSDGALVAFERDCASVPGSTYGCELAVVGAAGGGARALGTFHTWSDGMDEPVWIPGTHLLVSAAGIGRFVEVDADTGTQRLIGFPEASIPLGARSDGAVAYIGAETGALLIADRTGRVLVRRSIRPRRFSYVSIFMR